MSPRARRAVQDGKLLCPGCNRWLHNTRFAPKRRTADGTVVQFHLRCRVCEQSDRTEQKNSDRAQKLVYQRAQVRADRADVPVSFFMEELNWKSLVPMFEAYLDRPDSCVCPNCGHPFLNERDFQIGHRAPPRSPSDWARHHARNLGPLCGSCNNTQSDQPYEAWLDDQEDRRLSVAAHFDIQFADPTEQTLF